MPAFTAFTTLSDKTAAENLGLALESLDPEPTGVGVFEIEDGSGQYEIGAYFIAPPDQTGLAIMQAAFGAAPFVVSELPDKDWVAEVRRELSPVPAGRFFVHGTHDAHLVPLNRKGICIDAAMAFGTGHHGTTLGCLRAYDQLLTHGFAPRRVADIGTGTAVLAMAAAMTSDAFVLASDMDQIAVDTAKANLQANGLAQRVRCIKAMGTAHPLVQSSAPYDLVFANILANPLKRLSPYIAQITAPGGIVILSGILNEQSAGVTAVYTNNGFTQQKRLRIGEWDTLVLSKS